MTRQRALQVILLIGVVGIGFSGTLTYREFCGRPGGGCGDLGAAGTILGYPACLYGLVMYAIVTLIAMLGLRARK